MRLKIFFINTAFILMILIGLTFPGSANSIENVFGFGLGLPYGGIGVNYELSFNDYAVPIVSIGYMPDNVGWNGGIRLYYPGRESKFRGRITGLYGTNTLLEKKSSHSSQYNTENGFSGGVGFNWRFGQSWAFDHDLFFVNSDVPAGYKNEGNTVKISMGFSYRW